MEYQKKKKEQCREIFEKIMAKIFPQLVTDTKHEIQEAQKTPNKIMRKHTYTQKHIHTEAYHTENNKNKEKIFKAARGK